MQIVEALARAVVELRQYSETPELDAELLLGHVLDMSRFELLMEGTRKLTDQESEEYKTLLSERAAGKPVAYLTGKKAFFDDVFYVNPHVLIPRPETELAVETGIELLKKAGKENADILDLCAGSGCIGISVGKFFDGKLVFADISEKALDVTKSNCSHILSWRKNIEFVVSDLFSEIQGTYDLIIANPPYLSAKDMKEIKNTPVSYEPVIALAGGQTGWECSERLLAQASRYLTSSGYLVMELGFEGASFIEKSVSGLQFVEIRKDYQGISRVGIWKKETQPALDIFSLSRILSDACSFYSSESTLQVKI